jgi:UDP-glucose 4-epimerase
MRVLVTGASGFVGAALQGVLAERGVALSLAVRRASGSPREVVTGDIGPHTDWREALAGCDAVVHLAARVHVMRDVSADPLAAFRAVNTVGTLNLARQAAQAGVRRFVYLSSIKVLGEGRDRPYTQADVPAPQDAYAVSKCEAEQGLRGVERESGMEVVMLRPPLIYGPGVKANFLSLMRAVTRGWPLPLGAVRNHRSLLYLGNLVSAIGACLDHPAAAGRTFLVSDGEDVATPELIRRLACALKRPARLLPVPPPLLRLGADLLGRGAQAERLLGSLTVDGSALREALGWTPPYTLDEGLRETARWYLESGAGR